MTAALALSCGGPPDRVDLVIRGGRVVDGSGGRPFIADVYVSDGRVVAVVPPRRGRGRGTLEIDATDLVVAPGFIDAHTHVERNLPSGDTPFTAWSFIVQGVTTIITGNCGRSVEDVAALGRRVETSGSQVNIATLLGHNTIRAAVMGSRRNGPASENDLAAMRARLDDALSAGALGLSSGLAYSPGRFASLEEVVAIGAPLRERGGLYATHIREEGSHGLEALDEAVRVADELGVPGHVCHFKAAGRANWGSVAARLSRLDEATSAFTIDVYPYSASSTSLEPLMPAWFYRLPAGQRRAAVADPDERARVRRDMSGLPEERGWPDYSYATVAYNPRRPASNGRTVAEIASPRDHPTSSSIEAQQDVLIDMVVAGGAQMVYHEMAEDDVRRVLVDERAMLGSDSGVRAPVMSSVPHPRGLGTFPRTLGRHVRERDDLSLAAAVRKMTSLPAQTFGLVERGRLAKGYWADITVFDPDKVSDRATYDTPLEAPEGIVHVIVNGAPTVFSGEITGLMRGAFLRRAPRDGEAPES